MALDLRFSVMACLLVALILLYYTLLTYNFGELGNLANVDDVEDNEMFNKILKVIFPACLGTLCFASFTSIVLKSGGHVFGYIMIAILSLLSAACGLTGLIIVNLKIEGADKLVYMNTHIVFGLMFVVMGACMSFVIIFCSPSKRSSTPKRVNDNQPGRHPPQQGGYPQRRQQKPYHVSGPQGGYIQYD